MIRFLQQDNKFVKMLFWVIIGAACIAMVIYLVPGLWDTAEGAQQGVYATVSTPGLWGRFFGDSTQVKTDAVTKLAQRQLQQQHYPDFLLPYMMSRAGQVLVQRAILKQQADKLNLQVSDNDLRRELETGEFAQYLFPGGKYIGDEAYMNFVETAFGTTRQDFESQVKEDMELNRLQALITGGVTVSDAAVKQAYLVQGTKVKFDYAVVSADDLKQTINPTDAELQTFFKQNAAKYAQAIPETRKIEYIAFDATQIPGGKPQVTDAEIQAYYGAHQDQYKTQEEVKTRHILISVPPGADAKTDAAAKAKAEDVLKQLKAGAKFADLAKKYSDDPGSKNSGGEIPMIATSSLDPAYAKAALALQPGQTSGLVRSQFGYHIIQTEAKQSAGVKPLADVKASIQQVLEQQKQGAAEQSFAQQLAAQAQKQGMDKAAAAHGLHAATTGYLPKDGVIGDLSDASALLTQAFTTDKGAAPASVSTGDGFAVFQVLDVKPAHAPDFASYKSHILDDYRDQRVPELLEAETKKLDDRAKVLNSLQQAAAEMKIQVQTSDLVGQDGQVPDLGAMSGPGSVAFTMPKGAISGPINTGQAGIVLTVTDKEQPTPEDITAHMDQERDQLLNEQRNMVFSVFLGTLTQKYQEGGGIKLSQQAAAPGGIPGSTPAGS